MIALAVRSAARCAPNAMTKYIVGSIPSGCLRSGDGRLRSISPQLRPRPATSESLSRKLRIRSMWLRGPVIRIPFVIWFHHTSQWTGPISADRFRILWMCRDPSGACLPPSPVGPIIRHVTRLWSSILAALLLSGCAGEEIRRLPGEPARSVEFRVEADSPSAPGAVSLPLPDGQPILLSPEAVIRNADIKRVRVSRDRNGGFAIELSLKPQAAARLHRETETHIGRRMAILLDGRVVSAPRINSAIAESVLINGDFTREQAMNTARALAP